MFNFLSDIQARQRALENLENYPSMTVEGRGTLTVDANDIIKEISLPSEDSKSVNSHLEESSVKVTNP